jgi:prevent-host-death family protein
MPNWNVTAARGSLPEILRRVAEGEEVVLTRHDKPVAVILRPDTVRVRRAEKSLRQAAELREELVRSRGWDHPPGGIDTSRAEELVDWIRVDRER